MALPDDFTTSLADAARRMNAPSSVEDTLNALVNAARASVPGFDHVGVSTIDRKGHIETRAATDDKVLALDTLQYALREGPCYETLRESQGIVVAPHLRHDQRWPHYVPRAVEEQGLRSQVAVRLFLDKEGVLGGLNLYSTSDEEIDPEVESMAEVFAAHAAVALGRARQVGDLQEALVSSRTIGTAIGIVMERYQLDRDRAFAFLARASSQGNIKLRDVAQEVVDKTEAR